MTTRIEKNKSPKTKWLKRLGILLLCILLLGTGTAHYMWNKINHTLDSTHQPLTEENEAHLNITT